MALSSDQRRYEVMKVLGKGGFGTVYKARLQASGGFSKEVALKVLNANVEGTEDFVRRLRDEARMLGLMRHRAIVQVDGLVKLEDRWAIVMEFIEGASLREILGVGPVPPGVALEICEEVASALHVAFGKPSADGTPLRLLHRDIKPGNVQVTAGGEVKLLDFGVARAEFTGREAETRSLIFGSLAYMAPERMDFEDTHKGDIYALAATLYELTMGEQTVKASINPRKHVHIVKEMHDAHLARVGDKEMAAFLARCFSYEPEDRPGAREFEREARRLRQRYPQPWLRDWAEDHIPVVIRRRDQADHIDDDWSGAVISESSGMLAEPTLALDGPPEEPLDTVPSEHPILEATRERPTPPPQPERRTKQAAAKRRKKKKKRGGAVRWVLATLLTGFVLAVLIVVVVFLLAGGGLIGLMYQTGIMAEAYRETTQEEMAELEQLAISSTPPDANQQIVVEAVRRVALPQHIDHVEFWPKISFAQRVEEVVKDGTITDAEAQDVDQRSRHLVLPK